VGGRRGHPCLVWVGFNGFDLPCVFMTVRRFSAVEDRLKLGLWIRLD